MPCPHNSRFLRTRPCYLLATTSPMIPSLTAAFPDSFPHLAFGSSARIKVFLRAYSFYPGIATRAVRQFQHRFKSRDLVREDFGNASPGSAESEVSSWLSAAKGEKFIIGHTTPTCTLCRWYIIHKGSSVKVLHMTKQRPSYSRYTDNSTANNRNMRLLLNHR